MMIKNLERAIEKIRDLPADAQEYAATLLEQVAVGSGAIYR